MSSEKKPRGRPKFLTDSAKKRKKCQANAIQNKSRIFLGNQLDRWNAFKEEVGAQTGGEVAKILLDSYYKQGPDPVMSCMPTPGPTHLIVSSTPAGPFRTPSMSMAKKRKLMEPELSGISSSDQENQGTKESHYLSGVEDIEACAVEKSSSFINPFDITIDTTGQFGMEDDSSDEDYQPSFCFNDR